MATVGRITQRYKMILSEVKVLDPAMGRVHAIVSSEAVDRDGDIIRASGWQLDNFRKHPVLVSSHNYGNLRSVIGEWESMEVKGKRLEGIARYYIGEGNDEADWGFKLAEKGRAAYSVGFIPDRDKAIPIKSDDPFGGIEFNGQELLEVSHVAIPSNPQALQQLKGLLDATQDTDPILRGLIESALADIPTPPSPIDYRGLLDSAVTRAYREVYPWSL